MKNVLIPAFFSFFVSCKQPSGSGGSGVTPAESNKVIFGNAVKPGSSSAEISSSSGIRNSALVGKWSSECIYDNVSRYRKFSLELKQDSNFSFQETVYLTEHCAAAPPQSTRKVSGTWTDAAGAQLDFKVSASSIGFSIYTDVALVNGQKACGFTDWKIDAQHNVHKTKVSCLWSTDEKSYFTIYKLDSNKLWMGRTPASDAPFMSQWRTSARHTQLAEYSMAKS